MSKHISFSVDLENPPIYSLTVFECRCLLPVLNTILNEIEENPVLDGDSAVLKQHISEIEDAMLHYIQFSGA